jgi:hypothetical protein
MDFGLIARDPFDQVFLGQNTDEDNGFSAFLPTRASREDKGKDNERDKSVFNHIFLRIEGMTLGQYCIEWIEKVKAGDGKKISAVL